MLIYCVQMASQQQQLSSIVAAQSAALSKQQALIDDYATGQHAHLASLADSLNHMCTTQNNLTQVGKTIDGWSVWPSA